MVYCSVIVPNTHEIKQGKKHQTAGKGDKMCIWYQLQKDWEVFLPRKDCGFSPPTLPHKTCIRKNILMSSIQCFTRQTLTSLFLPCVKSLKSETNGFQQHMSCYTQTRCRMLKTSRRPANNFIKRQQRCCENTTPERRTMAACVCLHEFGTTMRWNMSRQHVRPQSGSEFDASSSHRVSKLQMNHKWHTYKKNCLQLTTKLSLRLWNTHVNMHVVIYTHTLSHSVTFRPNNNQQLVLFPCVWCSFTSSCLFKQRQYEDTFIMTKRVTADLHSDTFVLESQINVKIISALYFYFCQLLILLFCIQVFPKAPNTNCICQTLLNNSSNTDSQIHRSNF